jgi:signal transduction histidine kinase
VNVAVEKNGNALASGIGCRYRSGHPSEEKDRIFDEFYQVRQSEHRNPEKPGFGATISKKFVEMPRRQDLGGK